MVSHEASCYLANQMRRSSRMASAKDNFAPGKSCTSQILRVIPLSRLYRSVPDIFRVIRNPAPTCKLHFPASCSHHPSSPFVFGVDGQATTLWKVASKSLVRPGTCKSTACVYHTPFHCIRTRDLVTRVACAIAHVRLELPTMLCCQEQPS